MKYLMALTLMYALLESTVAWGKVNCKNHKIYCAIVKLRPHINKKFAMRLSNEIYKASKKYKVDPYRVVAIMRQESGIKMNARNYHTSEKKHTECDEWERCITTITRIKTTTDFGLFQFHKREMKKHKLDIKTVMTNMPFTVNFAIKFLANKIRVCSKPQWWPETPWGCYNSANPIPHKHYVQQVNRFYLGDH